LGKTTDGQYFLKRKLLKPGNYRDGGDGQEKDSKIKISQRESR
jgi:hypothetical protein